MDRRIKNSCINCKSYQKTIENLRSVPNSDIQRRDQALTKAQDIILSLNRECDSYECSLKETKEEHEKLLLAYNQTQEENQRLKEDLKKATSVSTVEIHNLNKTLTGLAKEKESLEVLVTELEEKLNSIQELTRKTEFSHEFNDQLQQKQQIINDLQEEMNSLRIEHSREIDYIKRSLFFSDKTDKISNFPEKYTKGNDKTARVSPFKFTKPSGKEQELMLEEKDRDKNEDITRLYKILQKVKEIIGKDALKFKENFEHFKLQKENAEVINNIWKQKYEELEKETIQLENKANYNITKLEELIQKKNKQAEEQACLIRHLISQPSHLHKDDLDISLLQDNFNTIRTLIENLKSAKSKISELQESNKLTQEESSYREKIIKQQKSQIKTLEKSNKEYAKSNEYYKAQESEISRYVSFGDSAEFLKQLSEQNTELRQEINILKEKLDSKDLTIDQKHDEAKSLKLNLERAQEEIARVKETYSQQLEDLSMQREKDRKIVDSLETLIYKYHESPSSSWLPNQIEELITMQREYIYDLETDLDDLKEKIVFFSDKIAYFEHSADSSSSGVEDAYNQVFQIIYSKLERRTSSISSTYDPLVFTPTVRSYLAYILERIDEIAEFKAILQGKLKALVLVLSPRLSRSPDAMLFTDLPALVDWLSQHFK